MLSFPLDGAGSPDVAAQPGGGAVRGGALPIDVAGRHGVTEPSGVERELGDVVICPEHTIDLGEAIVHGVLHLVGMDHETDSGEMLALQAELLAWERR